MQGISNINRVGSCHSREFKHAKDLKSRIVVDLSFNLATLNESFCF